LTAVLRVGVIGANWGLNHVGAWRAVPGVEVTALCTSRRGTAEAAARESGVARAVWNASELIEDPSIEVIDVTPRPQVRVPLVLEALRAGKHVMQPLPFAQTLVQGHALLAASRTQKVVAAVENLHRYSPTFLQAKAMLDGGILGNVFTIHAHVRTGILLNPSAGYVYEWITDAASGASALRNFGAHLMHVLTWLFGEVDAVCADLRTRLTQIRYADGQVKDNGTEDSALLLLKLTNGATATVDASWCTTAGEGLLIDAVGESGRLQIRAKGLGPQAAEIRWAERGAERLMKVAIEERFRHVAGLPLRDAPEEPRRFPLAAMCFAFAEAVREGDAQRAHPTFDEASYVMQIVEAAYRSHETRTWVPVPARSD